MPNCYLISEESIESDKPTSGWCKLDKPETFNLLLPSIHPSRRDNYLFSGSDPGDAVRDLLTLSKDSASWPSASYGGLTNISKDIEAPQEASEQFSEKRELQFNNTINDTKPARVHQYEQAPPKLPAYMKYRPSCVTYGNVDAKTLDEARSLFFEKRKQKILYDWKNPMCPPQLPSDYDMFIAWASLSKNEKMKYVDEVTGGLMPSPPGQAQLPTNTVETERAVNALYASCPDALSWPSFEYLRNLQPQHAFPSLLGPARRNVHMPRPAPYFPSTFLSYQRFF